MCVCVCVRSSDVQMALCRVNDTAGACIECILECRRNKSDWQNKCTWQKKTCWTIFRRSKFKNWNNFYFFSWILLLLQLVYWLPLHFLSSCNCNAKMCTWFICYIGRTQTLPWSVSPSATSLTNITCGSIHFYWWQIFEYKNHQLKNAFILSFDRIEWSSENKNKSTLCGACALTFDNNSLLCPTSNNNKA